MENAIAFSLGPFIFDKWLVRIFDSDGSTNL